MTTIIDRKQGKQNTADRAGALSAGTAIQYTNTGQTLAFGGGTYTVKEVIDTLNEIAALRSGVVEAQVTAATRIADEKARLPALLQFLFAYLAFVKATFGNVPDTLATFGLAPKRTPKPRTAEQLAAAKAKAKATRKARGTVGPVKKKAIVGNVVGVTVTPITAPEGD